MGKYNKSVARFAELLDQRMTIRKELEEELSSLFSILEEDYKGQKENSISTLAEMIKNENIDLKVFNIEEPKNITASEIENYLWGWLGITSSQALNLDEDALIRFIYVLNTMNRKTV